MSEKRFTPGPWEAEPCHQGFRKPDAADKMIVASNGICPGTVWDFGEEGEANAHLIAAAPAMYDQHEADITDLDLLSRAIREGDPLRELLQRVNDILAHKKRVLARARGEQS